MLDSWRTIIVLAHFAPLSTLFLAIGMHILFEQYSIKMCQNIESS